MSRAACTASLLGLCLAAILSPQAPAEPAAATQDGLTPSLGGRLFTDFYLPTQSVSSPFQQVSTTAWAGATSKLSEESRAFVQGEGRFVDYSFSEGGRSPTTGLFSLREAYLSYSKGGFDLSAGKQILPWGKTDGINPTDFLTGEDFTVRNPDPEVMRLGTTAIQAGYTLAGESTSWNLTAVALPVPAMSVLLIPPALVPANVTLGQLATPEASFADTEVGARLSYYGVGWDFAVVGFHGWQHLPEFTPSINLLSGTATLVPTAHRINAMGLEASWSPGHWVLRGETAYVLTENPMGTDPFVQPSYLESVLGVEYGFSDEWHAEVQLIDKFLPHPFAPPPVGSSPSDEATAAVSTLNSTLLGYQEPNRVGLSARVSYRSEKSGWEAELFALAYSPAGYLLRPKVVAKLTDAIRISAGVEQYGGPQNCQLGSLSVFNSVFLEGKYAF
jgi:hypothetical protein